MSLIIESPMSRFLCVFVFVGCCSGRLAEQPGHAGLCVTQSCDAGACHGSGTVKTEYEVAWALLDGVLWLRLWMRQHLVPVSGFQWWLSVRQLLVALTWITFQASGFVTPGMDAEISLGPSLSQFITADTSGFVLSLFQGSVMSSHPPVWPGQWKSPKIVPNFAECRNPAFQFWNSLRKFQAVLIVAFILCFKLTAHLDTITHTYWQLIVVEWINTRFYLLNEKKTQTRFSTVRKRQSCHLVWPSNPYSSHIHQLVFLHECCEFLLRYVDLTVHLFIVVMGSLALFREPALVAPKRILTAMIICSLIF